MPRAKLTKSAIDALPMPPKDTVYWDNGCPGFGVKVTPKGRKVFIVLYRGAGSRLRKYTIGPYGRRDVAPGASGSSEDLRGPNRRTRSGG
jgi:Arm DNA-binding domain